MRDAERRLVMRGMLAAEIDVAAQAFAQRDQRVAMFRRDLVQFADQAGHQFLADAEDGSSRSLKWR